jgi:integrase/recombinase XerD
MAMHNKVQSLNELVDEFIAFKRSLGYSYQSEAYQLGKFKDLCSSMDCSGIPGKKEFQAWMMRKPSELPQSQHSRVSPIRGFHAYLYRIGFNTGYNLPKSAGTSNLRSCPHFFSSEEITRFFKICDSLTTRRENPGREVILPAAFRLVYCCGLRPIEAIRLKTEHVNMRDGYVDILQSKFHKDRRLDLSEELTTYLIQYKRQIERIWPVHTYFFPKGPDTCYGGEYLRANFKKIWIRANSQSFATQVRVYDFRHHFALSNLNQWIREGENVDSMILFLMKYMGHVSLDSTYYYLHLVPEFFSTYAQMTHNLSVVLPETGYEA